MINQRALFTAFIFALIFESLGVYAPGFYLAPSILIAGLLALAPFSISILNFFLAWVFGIAALGASADLFTRQIFFSWRFLIHAAIYVSLLLVFIYFAYGKKER